MPTAPDADADRHSMTTANKNVLMKRIRMLCFLCSSSLVCPLMLWFRGLRGSSVETSSSLLHFTSSSQFSADVFSLRTRNWQHHRLGLIAAAQLTCPHWQAISVIFKASVQNWLQNLLSGAAGHRQAACAHLSSVSAFMVTSSRQIAIRWTAISSDSNSSSGFLRPPNGGHQVNRRSERRPRPRAVNE